MCCLKGGKHQDHDYEEINQAFEKYQEEMLPSLEPMEKQVTTIKKGLTRLELHREEVADQRSSIEYDTHNRFSQLQEILNTRRLSF